MLGAARSVSLTAYKGRFDMNQLAETDPAAKPEVGMGRRGFLTKAGATLALAAAWVTGVAAPAKAGSLCIPMFGYVGCSACHGGCDTTGCPPFEGSMVWNKYRNWTNLTQCCTDHGPNGCIGVDACSGGKKWWMVYVGQSNCCFCESG